MGVEQWSQLLGYVISNRCLSCIVAYFIMAAVIELLEQLFGRDEEGTWT